MAGAALCRWTLKARRAQFHGTLFGTDDPCVHSRALQDRPVTVTRTPLKPVIARRKATFEFSDHTRCSAMPVDPQKLGARNSTGHHSAEQPLCTLPSPPRPARNRTRTPLRRAIAGGKETLEFSDHTGVQRGFRVGVRDLAQAVQLVVHVGGGVVVGVRLRRLVAAAAPPAAPRAHA